jgi:hypothetical protein
MLQVVALLGACGDSLSISPAISIDLPWHCVAGFCTVLRTHCGVYCGELADAVSSVTELSSVPVAVIVSTLGLVIVGNASIAAVVSVKPNTV